MIIALIFIIVLSILGIATMSNSALELKMAGNMQYNIESYHAALSGAKAIKGEDLVFADMQYVGAAGCVNSAGGCKKWAVTDLTQKKSILADVADSATGDKGSLEYEVQLDDKNSDRPCDSIHLIASYSGGFKLCNLFTVKSIHKSSKLSSGTTIIVGLVHPVPKAP